VRKKKKAKKTETPRPKEKRKRSRRTLEKNRKARGWAEGKSREKAPARQEVRSSGGSGNFLTKLEKVEGGGSPIELEEV